VRCPCLEAEAKVGTIVGIFPLVVVVGGTVVQNPRRGCHRVQIFSWAKIIGDPPPHTPHYGILGWKMCVISKVVLGLQNLA
jgi:hypothetical protein